MIHKVSILIVIASVVAALVWDAIMLSCGDSQDSWSQACRDLNRDSAGLIALCSVALWVHLFLLDYLPKGWHN